MKSAEQLARDLLEQMEIEEAQAFSAGDVLPLANLIAENLRMHAALTQIAANHRGFFPVLC